MTWEKDYLRQFVAAIAHHGRVVQYVIGDPYTAGRGFAYTVGLQTEPGRYYELAISGLDPVVCAGLVDDVASALATGGSQPTEDLEINGLLGEGLPLRLRRVRFPERLKMIHAVYGTTPVVWQICWPDPHGRFPGDPLCTTSEYEQPLL
jgi:hypothetical protein